MTDNQNTARDDTTVRRISESTIRRLSVYFRSLALLESEGYHTVSSKELARREKLTPAQVRKDLSFFGSFGTRGLGYPTKELKQKIASILGIDRTWHVALVGAGNIGSALAMYKEFAKQGFEVNSIFDNDQRKIGSNHKGITIEDVKTLPDALKQHHIEIVVIAVPSSQAQKIADICVEVGIKSILNFAPINLKVPPDVVLRTVNMSMEMEYLSFYLRNRHDIDIPGKG